MAKNKKPRKKRRLKPCRIPIFTKEDIEGIRDQLDTCELAIRSSFPAGTAKFDTLESARRVLNHALCGFGNRTHLDKDEVAQATKLMYDAGDSLDVCPGQTLKEWFAGKRLEARGKYPITNEMIQAEVLRLADIPTCLWDTKR